MARTITYDNINLQANGITSVDIETYSSAGIQNQLEPLTQEDGGVLVKRRLNPKIVRVAGYLREDTNAELDETIDFFQQSLNKRNKFLDVEHGASTRRFVATPNNIIVTRPQGLNYATFDVEFLVPGGVGQDTETSTLLDDSSTTLNKDFSLAIGGSYKAEPLIEITLTAVTGGTGGSITISNATTLEGVTISADFVTSDLIEVDVANKEVRINGQISDYTGRIPEWSPGDGVLNYTDTFTTRTADIMATYTKRYI